MQNYIIENSINKNYCFIDQLHKRYVNSYYIANNQVVIQLYSDMSHVCENAWMQTPNAILSIQKNIKSVAPVDTRIHVDGVEIVDLKEKSSILNGLQVIAINHIVKKYIQPITTNMLKRAAGAQILRDKTLILCNSAVNKIDNISLDKCKQIMAILEN